MFLELLVAYFVVWWKNKKKFGVFGAIGCIFCLVEKEKKSLVTWPINAQNTPLCWPNLKM